MKKIPAAIVFGCLLLFTASVSWSAQPTVVLPEPVYDFGTVFQGDTVEHAFLVRNAGTAPLVVAKTKTSCGCTVADTSFEELAPGQVGKIKVRFDSTRFKNAIRKKIYLYTNDPEQPVSHMYLVGQVKELIAHTPHRLVVKAGNVDEPVSYQVTLTNQSDRAIALTGAKSSSGALKVSLRRDKLPPGESTVLDVTRVPGRTPPEKRMWIEVYTDQESLPTLLVPIRRVVDGDSST